MLHWVGHLASEARVQHGLKSPGDLPAESGGTVSGVSEASFGPVDRAGASGFLDTGRGRFHYLDWGGSGPLLHLGHGTGFCAAMYAPMARLLARGTHVLGMDDRGHGASQAEADPARLRNWDIFYQDMRTVLDLWGEPAVLVGHSRGGVIASYIASRWPQMVQALVLLDPTILPLWWMWWWWLAKKTGPARLVPIAYRAKRRRDGWQDREEVLAAWQGRGPFAGWDQGFLTGYVEHGLRERPGGGVELCCAPAWESRCLSTCEHRIWSRLAKIKCPVLVLHGLDSDVFMPPAVRRIRQVLPGAQVVGIEGEGHFLPMRRPGLCADVIREFLQGQGLWAGE